MPKTGASLRSLWQSYPMSYLLKDVSKLIKHGVTTVTNVNLNGQGLVQPSWLTVFLKRKSYNFFSVSDSMLNH